MTVDVEARKNRYIKKCVRLLEVRRAEGNNEAVRDIVKRVKECRNGANDKC